MTYKNIIKSQQTGKAVIPNIQKKREQQLEMKRQRLQSAKATVQESAEMRLGPQETLARIHPRFHGTSILQVMQNIETPLQKLNQTFYERNPLYKNPLNLTAAERLALKEEEKPELRFKGIGHIPEKAWKKLIRETYFEEEVDI